MIKILHTADWHLGKKLENVSRMDEQVQVMQEICEIAEREHPDLVIVAGDLFDQFNPPIEAQDLLYKTLKRLSAEGSRPVLAIAGNHDSPDRIESVDPLARYNGIFFSGYPNSLIPVMETDKGWRISASDEGFLEFRWDKLDFPLRILHTAFPNEFRIKKDLGNLDDNNLSLLLSGHWQGLVEKWCKEPGVQVLTTHLFASSQRSNYEEEDGERATLNIGGSQVVLPEHFPAEMNYVALGHLHRPHAISSKTPHINYSGSPLAYSFAEAGQEKYVNLVELEPGRDAQIHRIALQSGRKLLKFEAASVAEAQEYLRQNPDSIVDLSVRVEEFLDAGDRRSLTALNPHLFITPLSKDFLSKQAEAGARYATGNMEDHFREFFREKSNTEPSNEIMKLFKEILATDISQ